MCGGSYGSAIQQWQLAGEENPSRLQGLDLTTHDIQSTVDTLDFREPKSRVSTNSTTPAEGRSK